MGELLTILDKIASVIAQTCVIEYDKKFNKLADIDSDSYNLDLKETIKEDRVTYTVIGDFGKDINNPDITFIFMDDLNKETIKEDRVTYTVIGDFGKDINNPDLNKDTLPELQTLVGQVKNYYITLKLLSLTKED